jgi:hypothetical protein
LFAAACCLRSNCLRADSDVVYANGFDSPLVADAFFVSTQGLDTNPGTADQPFLTITKGISAAAADPLKRTVLVAEGTYSESIALADGVSVFGQYQNGSWAHDLNFYTIIDGVSSVGNHDRTVVASNITSATTLDGFVIFGSVNDKPGGNSYAIYISGSNANLHITNNFIFGGRGGPGADGSTGPDGLDGVTGSGRNPNLSVADAAYDAMDATGTGACDTTNNRQYANGGALMCGGTAVTGGSGGGNRCPVMSFCDLWDANYGCLQNATNFHWTKYTALDGAPGAAGLGATDGTSGVGATSGDDMIQIYAALASGYVCYIPPDATTGFDGGSGGNGGHGSAVAGCSVASGMVIGDDWVGGVAPAGVVGGIGGGGGGGGAGGGGKCENDVHGHTACADGGGKDTLGGHGGGGGSGACGGDGGAAGNSGGGAFGIFILGSSTAPFVTGNTLFGGSGGRGGAGGKGGTGGIGGLGAIGGTSGVPGIFCTDVAGQGGNGGDGGDGSGGGGGCGGASYGIYTFGIGTPDYCTGTNNTIIDGAAGSGGSGGLSLVNTGGSGASGVLAGCSFN